MVLNMQGEGRGSSNIFSRDKSRSKPISVRWGDSEVQQVEENPFYEDIFKNGSKCGRTLSGNDKVGDDEGNPAIKISKFFSQSAVHQTPKVKEKLLLIFIFPNSLSNSITSCFYCFFSLRIVSLWFLVRPHLQLLNFSILSLVYCIRNIKIVSLRVKIL